MDCNIRNMPVKLMVAMKHEAVSRGTSLRVLVIETLEGVFDADRGKVGKGGGGKADGVVGSAKQSASGEMATGKTAASGERVVDSAGGDTGKRGKLMRCPKCGSDQLRDWGKVWKCNQCRHEW